MTSDNRFPKAGGLMAALQALIDADVAHDAQAYLAAVERIAHEYRVDRDELRAMYVAWSA